MSCNTNRYISDSISIVAPTERKVRLNAEKHCYSFCCYPTGVHRRIAVGQASHGLKKKSKVENRWAILNSWTSATETKKTYAEHFRTSSDIKLIKLKGSRHKGEVDDISIEFVFS